MLFSFYYRNSVDLLFKTLLWDGAWHITVNILIVMILSMLSLRFLKCDYSILRNRICFPFSMVFYKKTFVMILITFLIKHSCLKIFFHSQDIKRKISPACFTWQSRLKDCCRRCVKNREATGYTIVQLFRGMFETTSHEQKHSSLRRSEQQSLQYLATFKAAYPVMCSDTFRDSEQSWTEWRSTVRSSRERRSFVSCEELLLVLKVSSNSSPSRRRFMSLRIFLDD